MGKKWTPVRSFYGSTLLGYWEGRPVVVYDGSGVVFPSEGQGLYANDDDGKWYCHVVGGRWQINHASYFGSCAPGEDEIEIEAHNEIAEETGCDVGVL